MATTATQVELLTRQQACAQLKLKERRLRDFVTAGRIRQSDDGRLHAGDVANLQAERQSKKAGSQARAIAAVATGLTPEQKARLQGFGTPAGQSGNAATVPPGSPAMPQLQIAAPAAPPAEAPEIRLFDHMPACVRLTVRESAAYLRVPRSVIVTALDEKKLQGIKAGRSWRIKKSDLDAL